MRKLLKTFFMPSTLASGALFIVIVSLAVLFLRDLRLLRRHNAFAVVREEMRVFLDGRESRAALTEKDIDSVKPWMTFDYLNRIFLLPPGYLKNALRISDRRYPDLALAKEAKKNRMHPAAYAERVKNAIREYFNNK